MMPTQTLAKLLNTLNVISIAAALFLAFVLQFGLSELPCPLCLLQRIGLLSMAFGFLLNIHYEIRPMHYALVIISAFITAIAAMRQMVMNALPPHGYGYPEFGFHLYTWVFLLSAAMIFYTAILLSIPGQYGCEHEGAHIQEAKSPWVRKLSHFAFGFFLLIILANAVSTYFECGLANCAGDFLTYKVKL